MGLIIVIGLAIVFLFIVIGKLLLNDLGMYFWNMLKGQLVLFNKKDNNFGQLLSVFFIAIFIGVLSFLLYKTILMLAAYLLTDNLIEFFVVNRGVFSSYGTELQNPYLAKHLLYGVLLTPIAQLFSVFFMIKSMQVFMLSINKYFNQKMFKVSSVVFFGAFSSVTFLLLELSAYAQHITVISTLSLVVLLISAKLSYLLFYFSITHIELFKNSNYHSALKDLKFNKLEYKLITKPKWMIIAVLLIAIILNFLHYKANKYKTLMPVNKFFGVL